MSKIEVRGTWIATAMGLVALCVGVGVTLSRSPVTLARSNLVNALTQFETLRGQFAACQGNETLPAHVTAIRLSLDSVLGPELDLRVLSGKHLLTEGQRAPGWTSADVTIPVKPVAVETRNVSVCFSFTAIDESVGLTGEPVSSARATGNDDGLIKVEYLRPGKRSWLSLVSSVADHMAFGHAWSGAWLAPALLTMMLAIAAVVAWVAVRLAR